MTGSEPSTPKRPRRPWLSAQWLLPLGLAGLALLAAPFYGKVMENVLWMGQTVRALCGF